MADGDNVPDWKAKGRKAFEEAGMDPYRFERNFEKAVENIADDATKIIKEDEELSKLLFEDGMICGLTNGDLFLLAYRPDYREEFKWVYRQAEIVENIVQKNLEGILVMKMRKCTGDVDSILVGPGEYFTLWGPEWVDQKSLEKELESGNHRVQMFDLKKGEAVVDCHYAYGKNSCGIRYDLRLDKEGWRITGRRNTWTHTKE